MVIRVMRSDEPAIDRVSWRIADMVQDVELLDRVAEGNKFNRPGSFRPWPIFCDG